MRWLEIKTRSASRTFDWNDLLIAIYIAIPTYVANSTPVLLGGGMPIDGGREFADRKRILGSHKTVRGFAGGLLLGSLAAAGEAILFGSPALILVGILASIGALSGDLLGAFLKRRLNVAPGNPLPIVDQLDFILGALLFTAPFLKITLGAVLILVIATVPIHLLANTIAYTLGLKSHFW